MSSKSDILPDIQKTIPAHTVRIGASMLTVVISEGSRTCAIILIDPIIDDNALMRYR